jgi:hypothetical protein
MSTTVHRSPNKLWISNSISYYSVKLQIESLQYLNGEDADVPVGEYMVDVEELEWCPGGLEHQDQKQGDDREPQVISPNHKPARVG